MRILLFGADGQLGTELRRRLDAVGQVIATTRTGTLPDGAACVAADFDTPQTLPGIIRQIAPDIVVNAAAYTAVDRAEDDAAAAFRVNAEAPARIAEACAASNAMMVHYSTDYVFDGSSTRPYREDDAVAPLSVYGASKLAGEIAIRASGARHMILRTAWVYASHGRNFMRTMLRLAVERGEIRVVSDQVGSPTPAWLIADVTAHALSSPIPQSGIWHLTTAGATSWCGFAEAIFAEASASGLLKRRPAVLGITSREYPTAAARPAYSWLDTSRLQSDFALVLPDWQDGLRRVIWEMSE